MSIASLRYDTGSFGLKARLPMLVAPVVALLYPFVLKAFNLAATSIASAGDGAGVIMWLTAGVCLLVAIAAPFAAMQAAMIFSEVPAPTVAQLRAKRIALFAVASPPIFVALGVVLYMIHDPVPDTWVWIVFWAIMCFVVARPDGAAASTVVKAAPAGLRVAHGVSALGIIVIFLLLHLTTHLTGLIGPETYMQVMKLFRYIYRGEILQPLLVVLFLFQVASGLVLVWRHTAAPSDRFRTFQVASGVYLALFVLGHMNSVFIYARTWAGIDTDWAFATGAPTGLIKDAWNIRLLPHYLLGVFLVLSHLCAGGRMVMISHGVSKSFADRFMIAGVVISGMIAVAIILGMSGLRLHFA
jgi:hypothetical protein